LISNFIYQKTKKKDIKFPIHPANWKC